MKESTRKIINYLRQYVGHEVLRTKPVCGDWSHTDSPLLLVGFTSDGCIRYRYTGIEAQEVFGCEEFVLPLHFTDRNWITYKKALKAAKDNELNKWIGKRIRRIRPTSTIGDCSFMSGEATILRSASKHHMVIMKLNGTQKVLNSDFINPEDWELVE